MIVIEYVLAADVNSPHPQPDEDGNDEGERGAENHPGGEADGGTQTWGFVLPYPN